MGNPFKDDFAELVTLVTRNCMDEAVVSRVRHIASLGKMNQGKPVGRGCMAAIFLSFF